MKGERCPRCLGMLVRDEYDDLGRSYCLSCGYDFYHHRPPQPEGRTGQHRRRPPSSGGIALD